jgi:tetraacyldisaccharide 4'-kinase
MSGPLRDWLRPVTVPASWFYRAAVAQRNRRYDHPGHVHHLRVPVISVGNLSTGGVGKTPMVMWIVEQLRAHGHRPVIALRGYGAGPGELSDEETEYMQRVPETDVVVAPNRYERLTSYLANRPEVDCAVLDDGFQHRRVHRDFDLVLIDATRETFGEPLLPAGHLREPCANLSRADAVVVTRCDGPDADLAAAIEHHHGAPPVAWCRHHWMHLDRIDAGGERHIDTAQLRGLRAITMLGIGNPAAFRAQLESHGVDIVHDRPVRDHHRYAVGELAELAVNAPEADALIITGKDWVKIEPLLEWESWSLPIIVPRVSLDVHHGADALRSLLLDVCPHPAEPVPTA